ncbi:hypothetical protein [Microbacterium sp. LWS13-1.2]|uniref:Carboxymuconolactone decarboxylase family protein n=1 Tax=Microbacterium sp. LWS13-1.2 TaxID=3135264 RepID=A0AAU6S9L9_9MICO
MTPSRPPVASLDTDAVPLHGGGTKDATERVDMDYTEHLRRLSIDAPGPEDRAATSDSLVDAKTRALVRLGALIAVSAAEASIHREVDEAVAAGAQASEVVGVLDSVMPLVGRACIVKASSKVASALGVELDLY